MQEVTGVLGAGQRLGEKPHVLPIDILCGIVQDCRAEACIDHIAELRTQSPVTGAQSVSLAPACP